MKISLGPVQYYWSRQTLWDLYEAVGESSADIVYLGETVCPKRETFTLDEWIEIGCYLAERGKEVVLSSRVLIETDADRRALHRLCSGSPFLVEASETGAVSILQHRGAPFVTGAAMNIYNARTLDVFRRMGLKRWVVPVEMDGATLADLLTERTMDTELPEPETEVFAHGHMPLAHSARCFTARAHDRSRDDCQRVCEQYPQGLALTSQEGDAVFRINGLQTQSAQRCNLLPQWPQMQAMGVDVMRFSPEDLSITSTMDSFRAAVNQQHVPVLQDGECNGYWFGAAGMREVSPDGAGLTVPE